MSPKKVPSTNDVLLGRGHFANKWEGNDFFRRLVQSFKHEYITTSNESKRQIAKNIVDIIFSLPGRFLKQDAETKYWIEVGEKDALRKTRQALREGQPQLVKVAKSSKECSLHSVSDGLDNEKTTSSPTLISETNASEDTFLKEINSILLNLEPNVIHSSKKRKLGYNHEDCDVSYLNFRSELNVKNSDDVQNNILFEQDPLIEFMNWMNSPIPKKYLQNNVSQVV